MCKAKKIISLLLAVVMLMGVMSAIEMSSIAGARELTISASASNSLTKKQAKKLKKKIQNAKVKNVSRDQDYNTKIETFKWKEIKEATGYKVQISKNKNFKKKIINKTVKTNYISVSHFKFKNLITYYIRIRPFTKYKINNKIKKVYGKWYKNDFAFLIGYVN